jgi:hypothetical protein
MLHIIAQSVAYSTINLPQPPQNKFKESNSKPFLTSKKLFNPSYINFIAASRRRRKLRRDLSIDS